jgi:hypothetical protein
MNLYDLPDETLVDISKVSPLAWFRICETVPFIGEWTPCSSTQRLIKKPFIQSIYSKYYIQSKHSVWGIGHHRVCWHLNGLLHRDGDLPAIVYSDGDKTWYKNGLMDNPP